MLGLSQTRSRVSSPGQSKADERFCPNGKLAGLHADGCFAEYFLALAAVTAKIPDELSFEKAAPMTCAGITIFQAIRKAASEGGLAKGGVLAISGLGALGHIGVQMAKAMVRSTLHPRSRIVSSLAPSPWFPPS